MSSTSVVVVADVSRKTGETDGRSWTRYGLKDESGEWYSTFEGGVVNSGLTGQTVEIEWEQNGNYKNLLRALPVEAGTSTATTAGDDKPDWDLIGLHKTRCALWVAAIQSPGLNTALARWIDLQQTEVGNADIQHVLERFAKALVLAAEVDIFHRAPAGAEENIPF